MTQTVHERARQVASQIKPLIYNDRFFVPLRGHIMIDAVEVEGVRYVDVSDTPLSRLSDLMTIALDPCPLPQAQLVRDGCNGDVSGPGAIRVRSHADGCRFTGCSLEEP